MNCFLSLRTRRGLSTLFVSLVALCCVVGAVWSLEAASPRASTPLAIELTLEEFATGFSAPVKVTHAGDERLFVVEQDGYIHIVQPDGTKLTPPFLDIDSRVASGGERGLLGLVFDPEDPSIFYVNYTRSSTVSGENGDTVIARYRVSAGDPNLADRDSEEIVLLIDQPYANHNAGDLAFSPQDGYLYIPMGDGGGGGDPDERSQDLSELLGKVLRIDVREVATYTIPAGNPYANDGDPRTRAEIWSVGWRNPYRFSFDRDTGDIYLGDVGQGTREEVDMEPANTPGRNYGWDCYEGNEPYELAGCGERDEYTFPIYDYRESGDCSVIGGYVYRGDQYPNMTGHYLFADYCSGNFWSMLPDGAGGWAVTPHGNLADNNPSGFGEDVNGELYVAALDSGVVYRIRDTSPAPTATPTLVATAPSSNFLPLIQKPE